MQTTRITCDGCGKIAERRATHAEGLREHSDNGVYVDRVVIGQRAYDACPDCLGRVRAILTAASHDSPHDSPLSRTMRGVCAVCGEKVHVSKDCPHGPVHVGKAFGLTDKGETVCGVSGPYVTEVRDASCADCLQHIKHAS